ncbi:SMI1/KNR4 family protein [Streptomyces sp. NPDC059900]|uniref:SMI1/KNR4 family protein n=1 Tax=Streptomyces sp. NPDC059900 TaxID=3155816 RepID=UPI00343B15E9
MVDQRYSPSAVCDFATWEGVLRLLRQGRTEKQGSDAIRVAGRIGRQSWSLPLRREQPGQSGQVSQSEQVSRGAGEDLPGETEAAETTEAVERVRRALVEAGVDGVSFNVKIMPDGQSTLRLLGASPAVRSSVGPSDAGTLLLVEGAVPEPWRRLPDPVPGAVVAPSADPALLERTLRERLPNAVGATEVEIAAAEARLGVCLPEELKVLYRVAGARWEDPDEDYEAMDRAGSAVGCELFPLDELYVADAASRLCPWESVAMEAVVTPPGAAVQGLVGSPGWIAFGDNGGGDRLCVDLTPGPCGHTGQIIILGHEENAGAGLVADSLTDLVLDRPPGERRGSPGGDWPPVVAHVNIRGLPSVEAAAHPALEVLSIGVREAEPLSLAPVFGLPRLRTLAACPGTLADPVEIGELSALEFLELGPEDWRVLLDAGAVPRGLLAAVVRDQGDGDPLSTVVIANELLALWDRPRIIRTALVGDLGPLPA